MKLKLFSQFLKESKQSLPKEINEMLFYFKQKIAKIEPQFSSTEDLFNHYRDIMVDCIRNVYPEIKHVKDEENNAIIKNLISSSTKNKKHDVYPNSEEYVTQYQIHSPEKYSFSLDFKLDKNIPTIRFQTNTNSIDPKFQDKTIVFITFENILNFLKYCLVLLMKSTINTLDVSNNVKGNFSNLETPDLFKILCYQPNKLIEIANVTYFINFIPNFGNSLIETDIDFSYNYQNLKALPKNLPKNISGNFKASKLKLTSLEGSPEIVGGFFFCDNNQLSSLKGSPTIIGKIFDCSKNKLTSLEGSPEIVGEDFNCERNKLTSLEGAPKKVGGNFTCKDNNLTSLEGAPKKVSKDFSCYNNKLTSLKDSPKKVGRDFSCSFNNLTSLEGGPEEVGEDFHCYNNKLTSLKGSPKKVSGNFACYNNNLTSLEGAPEKVDGNFVCFNNNKKFTEEEVRKVSNVKGGIGIN